MSIATQIEALQTDKTNIANAITAKGGTVASGDGFDDFANDIATIPTGGSGHNIYLYHFIATNDDGEILINGTDDYLLSEYMEGAWFNCSSGAMLANVNTFRLHGFEHIGSYPSSASSWARYRLHSGGSWIDINLYGETITLTADIDLEIRQDTCLGRGTLITMYDGSKKKIEDIVVGDVVRKYDGSSAVVTKDEHGNRAFSDDRDVWKFENGYEIITAFRHRFYNIEHQKMMYLNEWQIGEHAYSEKGERVALLEHIHEDIPCHYFSLWCKDDGNNYFAGGLLAGNRFTEEIHILEEEMNNE